jgi:rhodanese-related sulfurtransferase
MNGPAVKSITCPQLHELSRRQHVELIDVRTPEEFRDAHAAIARNVPIDMLDPQRFTQGRGGTADETLYFICQGGGRSSRACAALMAAGLTNVVNVEGGTSAWEAAGLPVARGKQPISIERQIKIVHGSLILLGCVLGRLVHPYWYGLAALIGLGQIATGLTDLCGTRACLRKMPWNR